MGGADRTNLRIVWFGNCGRSARAPLAHLWADRYDGELQDIFNFQDRITEAIVGVIEPNIRRAEIERARRKRPDSLGAYDLTFAPYRTSRPTCRRTPKSVWNFSKRR